MLENDERSAAQTELKEANKPVQASWTRYARWVGIIVSILCCVFVVRALWGAVQSLDLDWTDPSLLLALVGSSLLWVVLNGCLGIGWWRLVALLGERIRVWESVAISLQSQIAKYLPGNVFHFAGRVVLARKLGVETATSVKATTLEALALLGVGGVLSARLVLALPYGVTVGLVGVGLGLLILFMARARVAVWSKRMRGEDNQGALVSLLLISLSYVAVFIIQLIMFLWIASALGGQIPLSLLEKLEMISTSWVAGFVVIGSPGGIGVREYVLTLFAQDDSVFNFIVVVAALSRACSMLGDLSSFALGMVLTRPK